MQISFILNHTISHNIDDSLLRLASNNTPKDNEGMEFNTLASRRFQNQTPVPSHQTIRWTHGVRGPILKDQGRGRMRRGSCGGSRRQMGHGRLANSGKQTPQQPKYDRKINTLKIKYYWKNCQIEKPFLQQCPQKKTYWGSRPQHTGQIKAPPGACEGEGGALPPLPSRSSFSRFSRSRLRAALPLRLRCLTISTSAMVVSASAIMI